MLVTYCLEPVGKCYCISCLLKQLLRFYLGVSSVLLHFNLVDVNSHHLYIVRSVRILLIFSINSWGTSSYTVMLI